MSNTDTGDTSVANQTIIDVQTNVQPREALLNSAITFLTNPKVQRSPISQKQQFLRSKGLTENEIQIACERAGVFTGRVESVVNMGIRQPGPGFHPQPLSTIQKIKDILSTTALLAGITYAIYLFYKKFIEPLIFGRENKKSVPDTLEDIERKVDKNIKEMNVELGKIREELTHTTHNDAIFREFRDFKSDLDAIKGLMLNRKQFSSPVVPPSIPAWQLHARHTESEPCDQDDKHDDNHSGSGSSETEVVTKHSDSSMEMM